MTELKGEVFLVTLSAQALPSELGEALSWCSVVTLQYVDRKPQLFEGAIYHLGSKSCTVAQGQSFLHLRLIVLTFGIGGTSTSISRPGVLRILPTLN